MPRTAVARRYARALFGLARDEGRIAGVLAEIETLAGLFDRSAELRDALFRPLHPVKERRAVLDAVTGRIEISGTVQHFCSFLLERGRMQDFPVIREELIRLADEAAGRVQAEVVSATQLREEQLERLRRALAARTGRDVKIDARVDPALLGGVVAKVGDLVFDGSLRTQLAQLRANLTKGH